MEKSAVSWLCGMGGNSGRKPRVQLVQGGGRAHRGWVPRPLRLRALPGGPGQQVEDTLWASSVQAGSVVPEVGGFHLPISEQKHRPWETAG